MLNRISELHQNQSFARKIDFLVKSIYLRQTEIHLEHVPFCLPSHHTMYKALDRYVEQKLPVNELQEIVRNNGSIEVHGIYPNHFEYQQSLKNMKWDEIPFYHKPSTRRYNVVRPRFFRSKYNDRLIVCLAPGSDYIQHYGAMLRHACLRRGLVPSLELFHYPTAYETLASWTHLHRGFIEERDIVFIGYVQEIHDIFTREMSLCPIRSMYNPYLDSRRYRMPNGKNINFLGVNFSFWGNLSSALTESICLNGASEIIYVGKLGSLTTPHSLYSHLFIPDRYAVLKGTNIISLTNDLRNGILEQNPQLTTGMHISVPTVLEEDYKQRAVANKLNANSIDNEISQIAHAISNYNKQFDQNILFSAFHFATDYIRNLGETDLETSCDLSNNRDNHILTKKEFFLRQNARILVDYMRSK